MKYHWKLLQYCMLKWDYLVSRKVTFTNEWSRNHKQEVHCESYFHFELATALTAHHQLKIMLPFILKHFIGSNLDFLIDFVLVILPSLYCVFVFKSRYFYSKTQHFLQSPPKKTDTIDTSKLLHDIIIVSFKEKQK